MAKPDITAERLHELIHYDLETGVMTWKVSRNKKARPGSPVGYRRPDGYIQVRVDRKGYLMHRLIWFYVTGEWPENQIDHIDGDKADNRFKNLRKATQSENHQNQKLGRRYNKTGFLGVKRAGKYFQAKININGKCKNLGCFATAEEAYEAYLAAKRILHPFGTL